MTPQLLIVGHIVKDITSQGWIAGGGALYAAMQAVRLGVDTAVVTACESDIELAQLIPDVDWHIKPLDQGLQFDNTYTNGQREQRLLATSSALVLEDIPVDWLHAGSALLTPVFHDVDEGMPESFVKMGASVGLGAQGWLRSLESGRVIVNPVEAEPAWLHGDVIFVSEEDATDPESVEQWRQRIPTVVLTRGPAGLTVWNQEGRFDMKAPPACEQDPTGAGDVLAAAYMVRHSETADTREALRFAAAAAALSVEGTGYATVAGRAQIEARMRMAEVAC